MTWRNLHTLDLQLETTPTSGEEPTQSLVVRFSEGVTVTEAISGSRELGVSQPFTPANTLTLFDSTGETGTGVVGDPVVLESEVAALDLAQSQLHSDEPDGKPVALTLALRFKPQAAGQTYTVSLLASNDAGAVQEVDNVGTLAVGPFSVLLPVITRTVGLLEQK
jgi:hypothetical protein